MKVPEICRKAKFLQIPRHVPAGRGQGERGGGHYIDWYTTGPRSEVLTIILF